MSKIIDAHGILADARNCVERVWMAAGGLMEEDRDPIQAGANIASKKIEEAITLLDEYLQSGDAPLPARPADAKPVIRAARTKRKGK